MATIPPELDPEKLPKHIAIIMDGNGRWAQKRGMLRVLGHKTGVESVRNIVECARNLGIECLTLYAFSTENWKRPPLEVKALMALLQTFLQKELDDLLKNQISLRCVGDEEALPPEVRSTLRQVIDKTAANKAMILNIALSYGSRAEITRAARNIAQKCLSGELLVGDIDEQSIESELYTKGQMPPDLLIRTGGEKRLSNFLLWQASYAELYFTETYWPDFRAPQLIAAIKDYQERQRRFGKTAEQL